MGTVPRPRRHIHSPNTRVREFRTEMLQQRDQGASFHPRTREFTKTGSFLKGRRLHCALLTVIIINVLLAPRLHANSDPGQRHVLRAVQVPLHGICEIEPGPQGGLPAGSQGANQPDHVLS